MMYTIEILRSPDPRAQPDVLDRANFEGALDIAIQRAKSIYAMRGDLAELGAVRILENGGPEVFRWSGEG